MKKRILSFLLLVCMLFGITACGGEGTQSPSGNPSGNPSGKPTVGTPGDENWVDYVSNLTLDETTNTQKLKVNVHLYIDGDTTHFSAPESIADRGVMKARYLGVDTPESTGQVEEWGKGASNFTRSKLESAESIIVETDGEDWDKDSNGRHLVWVWYRTAKDQPYRNLNVELLQEGYAYASKSGENRYGRTCLDAIAQANRYELHVYADDSVKDPDFFYGTAYEITLKELRTNIEFYNGKRVAFDCTVSQYESNGNIFVEDFDAETEMTYGIPVFYGYQFDADAKEFLDVPGTRVRLVANITYWEGGGIYQASSLKYDLFDTTNPDTVQLLGENAPIRYDEMTAQQFYSKTTITKKVNVAEAGAEEVWEEQEKTVDYLSQRLASTVSMKNLVVKEVYTTANGGDNDGAISLTCEVGGKEIVVRTTVLRHADKSIVTQDEFVGKTIDVLGIIDYYSDSYNKSPYQIKVFSFDDITFH